MRRFVRHPTDIPIEVTISSMSEQRASGCCMTTVSQGGLSVEVDKKVSVGSRVNIGIPSVLPPYRGAGEVVWCHAKGDHFEVGVHFDDEQEAFRSRMVQQVCQIEHYKNMMFEREGRTINGEAAAAEWISKYAVDFAQ
ncbi:MAG: Tfp pilus assembly protein PilZ [Gammaproteobacteria bacterium]|jgi:Tfp pilus assembly protein PilZ